VSQTPLRARLLTACAFLLSLAGADAIRQERGIAATRSMVLAAQPSAPGLGLARPGCGRSPRLDAIGDYAREHDFNGTILIQDRGRTIYHRSFGVADRSFNIPAKNDTRYRIASITKAFTAVLILQLVEQGRLDLQGSIKSCLPGYTGEGGERITVHHLLNHTSGLQNFDTVKTQEEGIKNGIEQYQKPYTTDELLTRFCSGKLVHEVGKAFDYNNGDYIILGKIIEQRTGKSYEQSLKEQILQPLAMSDSGLLYQHQIVKGLADTYFTRKDLKTLVHDLPVYSENWYSAGAMYSTTADLLKFSNALYGGKLLKRETLGLMLMPGLDEYGYGVWVRNMESGGKQYRMVHRPGSIMGANGELCHVLERDLSIIVLSNTDRPDLDAFAFWIGRELIQRPGRLGAGAQWLPLRSAADDEGGVAVVRGTPH
jgi:D-alanyl-D-alanine carboxypeptidase